MRDRELVINDTADYSKMTDDDFRNILEDVVADMTTREILAVPGVYECLAEECNNEVLARWAAENSELAYPESEENEDE